MATIENEIPAPDITPISQWEDGSPWEDKVLIDDEYHKDGSLSEGRIRFYSYGEPVVEAEIALGEADGQLAAFIEDIERPDGYRPTPFPSEDSHFGNAFKTIFLGFQLDPEVKRVFVNSWDPDAILAVLRSGAPNGWKQEFIDSTNPNEVMENWSEVWQRAMEHGVEIVYERLPQLEGVGVVAIANSAEVQPVDKSDPKLAA